MSAIERVLRLRLLVAPVVVGAVVAGGLTTVGPAAVPARAASASVAVVADRGPSTAPDAVSAAIDAKASGHRVEVLSERTEATQVFVNPDGSVVSEIASAPVRMRDDSAKGGWRDVNLDLSTGTDGSLTPGAPLVPVAFSGGEAADADAALAVLDPSTAGALSVGWAGSLPKPEIQGNVATYKNVAEDTDLVLTATRFGFEQDFVINDRPADPAGLELPLSIDGDGLKVVDSGEEPDSAMSIETSKGKTIGTIGAAVTIDSTAEASGPNATTSDMALTTDGDDTTLTIKPDAAFLTDPETVYPVVIDPSFTVSDPSQMSDTFVRSDMGTTTYAGNAALQVGSNNSNSKYRTYLRFTHSRITGAKVTSASIQLFENGASSCTAQPVTVYADNDVDLTTTTWNANQPAIVSSTASSTSFAKGYSGCAGAYVAMDATPATQYLADNDNFHFTYALRASETTTTAWKQFDSANASRTPVLTVNYDHYPTAPDPVFPTTAVTVNGTQYSRWPKPNFSAKFTDAEGQTGKVVIQVWDGYSTSSNNLVSSCTTGAVSPGTVAQCTIPDALADNATFYVRAQAQSTYGGMNSPWSQLSGHSFRTAQATPPVPSISCPYGAGSWTTIAPTADVTCTVTAPTTGGYSAPMKLTTQIDNQQVSTATFAVGAGTSVSVTVPKTDGPHTVTARTYAAPGQTQPSPTSFTFGYGAAGLSAPATGTTTTGVVGISAMAPPRGTSSVTAALNWRAAGTTAWSADVAITGAPLKTGGGSEPVAVDNFDWSAFDATGSGMNPRRSTLLDIRVCFTFSGTSGPQCTAGRTILRVPHAFGEGFPTAAAGEGTVALWSGELALDATDVDVAANLGSLSVSRSHATFQDPQDAVTGVFGPGWSASFGDDSDATSLQVADSTTVDGTVAFTSDGEDPLVFREPGNGITKTPTGTYAPVGEVTKTSGYGLTSSGAGSGQRLVLTNADGEVSTWGVIDASAAKLAWSPISTAEAANHSTETYTTDATGRVTRILAPVPNGVTCGAGTSITAGCSALTISYSPSSTTSPTGTNTGAYAGRVSTIAMTGYDPSNAAMKTTIVATYAYDAEGRLAIETDALLGLNTRYEYAAYGSNVAVTKVTHDGYAPFTYAYDTSGTNVRLASVQRGAASSGGSTATIASFVYAVPTATSGLPDLSAAQVAKWGQTRVPTAAYAVFGLDHPVTSTSPANLAASDWLYATLHFTDDDGYETNSDEYGAGRWLTTAQFYDTANRPSSTLDPSDTDQAANGIASDINAGKTITRYNADRKDSGGTVLVPAGTYPLDTWGPVTTATVSGQPRTVRAHTHYDYDQGAPNSGINAATGDPYLLVTTTTVGITDPGNTSENPADTLAPDLQTSAVTTNGYDPIDGASTTGATSGWTLGQPTVMTIVMPNSADNIVRKARFDADGNAIETREPGSSGIDAGTTTSIFYTAAANPADAACGNKPQWAGLTCWRGPAAAPESGTDIPDTRASAYNRWLEPTSILETSGTGGSLATRTTSQTYLTDGRLDITTATTSGVTGSTALPAAKALYDTATKVRIGTANVDSGGATISSVTTTLDLWGRTVGYTDASNNTTATSYVAPGYAGAGAIAGTSNAKGTTSYIYDGTDAEGKVEHRGVPTQFMASNLGIFAAAYDASGNLTTESMPGAIVQRRTYDGTDRLTGLAYTGQGGTWLAYSRSYNGAGHVDTETDTTGRSTAYSYDRADRLTSAADTTISTADHSNSCTTRAYSFDPRGNRTSLATATAAACTTTGAITTTWSYDAYSRQQTGANGAGAYAYDGFGRQTTIPASDAANSSGAATTVGYFDDDTARSITQSGATTTYGLDPDGRRLSATASVYSAVNAYGDDSDNPDWVTKTQGATVTTSRYVSDLAGGLSDVEASGSTTTSNLQLSTPGGSIGAVVPLPTSGAASGIATFGTTDEYGRNLSGSVSTGVARYGWHGTDQRELVDSGQTLMGARLYNPVTGRFSSTDPVVGGNENAYVYPNDPIDQVDLTGESRVPDGGGRIEPPSPRGGGWGGGGLLALLKRIKDVIDHGWRPPAVAVSNIAKQIARGHAWSKHVVERREFPGIKTQSQFARLIDRVMKKGISKHDVKSGKTYYWYEGTFVVRGPIRDGGTAFRQDRAYFDRQPGK